jgi:hypothetical protein
VYRSRFVDKLSFASVSQPEGWEPNEYQSTLLTAVGSADPAQIQSGTADAIRELIAAAADHLRTRPEPREWSVYQCIGHILDAELVISGRYRWILAQPEPEIMPYEQDMWADYFHGDQAEAPEEMLVSFEALRRSNVALWQRTPVTDRSRLGMHRERGPESYELTFRLTAGHDVVHLDQARRALVQVRSQKGG